MKHRRITRYLYQHRLLLVICVAASVVTASFLATLTLAERQSVQTAADAQQQSSDRTQAYLEKQRRATQLEKKAKPAPSVKETEEPQQEVAPASCRATQAHSNPHAIDIIVNKKNCIQPLAFVPTDMEVVHGATISAKAIPQFTAMYTAAQAAGLPFIVSSSYRSYDQQVTTYNYWVSVNGQAGADTVSARAGYSEHQTGLTIDVATEGCWLECFTATPQRAWLQQYAADYGFIERYPVGATDVTGYSPESWHYRYVGVQVAQDMKKRGIATLEQYWGIAGGDYAG